MMQYRSILLGTVDAVPTRGNASVTFTAPEECQIEGIRVAEECIHFIVQSIMVDGVKLLSVGTFPCVIFSPFLKADDRGIVGETAIVTRAKLPAVGIQKVVKKGTVISVDLSNPGKPSQFFCKLYIAVRG
jgi:hypothetical protein